MPVLLNRCRGRYFVGTAGRELLRYLTKDSDWITKICAGLIAEGAGEGGGLSQEGGGATSSRREAEREEALTADAVAAVKAASSSASIHGMLKVRAAMLLR
jgi:hypothetical protein